MYEVIWIITAQYLIPEMLIIIDKEQSETNITRQGMRKKA